MATELGSSEACQSEPCLCLAGAAHVGISAVLLCCWNPCLDNSEVLAFAASNVLGSCGFGSSTAWVTLSVLSLTAMTCSSRIAANLNSPYCFTRRPESSPKIPVSKENPPCVCSLEIARCLHIVRVECDLVVRSLLLALRLLCTCLTFSSLGFYLLFDRKCCRCA